MRMGAITMYAFFDGDNIGKRLEILLTEGQIEEAVKLSLNIQQALNEIGELLKSTEGVSIIIIGGDDILIEFDHQRHDITFLESIRDKFHTITGNTMSCGLAKDIPSTIWNLHLAKLYGKGIIRGLF